MKKYFNLRSIMIAVSILLCLVGTSALGYLHVTQPTASAIEKKEKKTKEAKEKDIEKSTPETKNHVSNLLKPSKQWSMQTWKR